MTAPPPAGIIIFRSAATADCRVAGLPAVARAVGAAARGGLAECWVDIGGSDAGSEGNGGGDNGGGWHPDSVIHQEILRMAGTMRLHLPSDDRRKEARPAGAVLLMSGEVLAATLTIAEENIRATLSGAAPASGASGLAIADVDDLAARQRLSAETAAHIASLPRAGRRIIAATAKPGDGIVSRHINRPISQAISRLLLNFAWIRPIHATAGTALLGLGMLASLIFIPDQAGLISGAILFQTASVFDGVDGEIARATFRTSERGALIDSLVDAATNLAFVAGVVANLWHGGHHQPALFGVAGLAMLALGLTIIGRRARAQDGPFSFDGVKQRVRATGSRIGLWLTWLTMRDFIALASVVLVVAGLAVPALVGFSVIMALWLIVVLATGARQNA